MNFAILGIIAFIVFVVGGILATGYVKASPDEAIIISGPKRESKVVIGKAAIKIPFFERKDRLSLQIIKIDVKTSESVPTKEFINVNVDAVVTVKIGSSPELIKLAAENFLNRDEDYVRLMVKDVLEGNIREIVGTMTLEDMIGDRKQFSESVQHNAVPDMMKMGIEIVSFNVQNFSDKNGVIEDLGIDNTMKIRKTAAISKAEAEKEIEIAQAIADKEANDAKVKSQQEIAIKQNELEIKEAELKMTADTEKAKADASYEIQKEAERKSIEIATADANLAKQEKELELKERQIEIKEKTLDAEIKKKADADKYARQMEADAKLYERTKNAEADRIEAEEDAKAKEAVAKADRIAEEEKAKGIEAVMKAEAEGIKAKGLAEAEGIDKKAEAMLKMQDAAILEMYFSVLPEIAKNVAEPLKNIDKITMYGEGNTAKMVGDITKSTTQITEGLTEGLGIDMKSVIAGFMGGKASSNGISGEDIMKAIKEQGITEEQIKAVVSNMNNSTEETASNEEYQTVEDSESNNKEA